MANCYGINQGVFSILDYMLLWLQGKKKECNGIANPSLGPRSHREEAVKICSSQIRLVEQFLSTIPAQVISRRAVECKSYSRALFHWEQYIRQQRAQIREDDHESLEPLYQRLQEIYTQIDEPDGVEGISAHLHVLDIDQQILEHQKAGRWVAAQSWYELQLSKTPQNSDAQVNLMMCLKESGHHGRSIFQ